jgi:hypothetical protein
MGKLLAGLETTETIKEDGDFLGGFNALDSGIVNATVELAYVTVSDGGAKALNVTFKTDEGQTLRQQFWMTSGAAKGGLPYYVNKTTLEKKYLPGFVHANHLCLLTAGKRITTLDTAEKMINLYSPKEGKELPTKVDMVMDLLGKQITIGVIKQTVDKTKEVGVDPATGKKIYAPSGETRVENEVDKFFRQRDGLTVAEIKAKMTEPKFKTQWAEKWTDLVRDKSTGVANATFGAPKAGRKTAVLAEADALFA